MSGVQSVGITVSPIASAASRIGSAPAAVAMASTGQEASCRRARSTAIR